MNVESIRNYFEDRCLKNEKLVNNSITPLRMKNLVLQNQSTMSADVYANGEGTSASNFGGVIERTTSASRRQASRTSCSIENHETSPNTSRAQLTMGPKDDMKRDTGCNARIQGD